MIKREKVLITVKTYPTLSAKYGELVCTAGIKEDGAWVRIYPYPFSWEVGQLYWNCVGNYKTEQEALMKVKQKYFDEFVSKKDLYFFVGTTLRYHSWGKNPFIIIGTFHPPKVIQKSFDFDAVS
jgi:hypothetical protein